MSVAVALVVAVARNGVIGRGGDMPWRLSSDLKRFKSLTMGKPLVMGRKTHESIGRALPGRTNIVVSSSPDFSAESCEVARSVEQALEMARAHAAAEGASEICVLGGGEIYRQTIALADRLHVTHVLADIDGDTVFPEIRPEEWTAVSSEDHPAGEKDSHATRYTVYERAA